MLPPLVSFTVNPFTFLVTSKEAVLLSAIH
jgi:hypothetical protein